MASPYANYELLFADNVQTTLGSNLTSSATTMTVATGAGTKFPNPGTGQAFLATLVPASSSTGVPNEVVLVTQRSGDSMTIERGQDGTTPMSFSIGDTVAMFVTAGAAEQAVQPLDLQAQAGNWAVSDTGSANAGVITLSPVPVSLTGLSGAPIRVKKTTFGNTGAYTLNVNGLGATPVTWGGLALVGGELPGDVLFTVVYNGYSAFELQSGPTGKISAHPSTGASAGFNIGVGSAPGGPVQGDLYMTTTGLFAESPAGVAQIPYAGYVQNQLFVGFVDNGSANAYNIDPVPAYPDTADFLRFCIRISATNTGASTLSINGGTAHPIKKVSSGSYVDPAAGDLVAGHIYDVVFNGAVSEWQLMGALG